MKKEISWLKKEILGALDKAEVSDDIDVKASIYPIVEAFLGLEIALRKAEEKGPKKVSKELPQIDTGEIRDYLKSVSTREEAENYLRSERLTVAMLKQLLTDLKARFNPSDKKDVLIQRVVERTVGTRLKFRAFHDVRLTMCPTVLKSAEPDLVEVDLSDLSEDSLDDPLDLSDL